MGQRFLGAFCIFVSTVLFTSAPVLWLCALWIHGEGPHGGGYPKGQLVGTGFLDVLFGAIFLGCAAGLLDW